MLRAVVLVLLATAWTAHGLTPDAGSHKLRAGTAEAAGPQAGWAVLDASTGELAFSAVPPNEPRGAPARASFSPPSQHKSNFGQVRVETNSAYENKVQMQAAGFVEGYLTAETIFNHWFNWQWWLLHQTNDTYKIGDWLQEHYAWVKTELAAPHNQGSRFWEAMELVIAQFDGMMAGYNARVSAEGPSLGINFIPLWQFLILNTMGDMDDLLPALFPAQHDMLSMQQKLPPPAVLRSRLYERGHCSVLIKVTGDLSDLLVGHVTWWTYTGMTRLYKHYTLNLNGEHFKARKTSMSSYPGMISSMDDFYLLSPSHLVVTETTNDVFDTSLYKSVVPQAALSWQRVLVANWLSDSGDEWAQWIEHHNSGTYNNQYMVLDLKRFKPKQELQAGLLTVIEQIPGLVVSGDVTQDLERGYWPSYNVPYFPEIYKKCGYPQMAQRLANAGEEYAEVITGLSYQLAPRAKLSRRDAGAVTDLASLKMFLRGNNFKNDPYSGGSAWGAICGRGDLDPEAPRASGCNDAKVTSYSMALNNTAEAINGPTLGSGLKPFAWAKGWQNVAHRGMADVFNFAWELQRP